AEPAGDAHEHRMLRRMHAAVRRNGHQLDLQKQLQQEDAAPRDAGETVDLAVEIEVRRFAAIERRLRGVALLRRQPQTIEQRLGRTNLVARVYRSRLDERSHPGVRLILELRA